MSTKENDQPSINTSICTNGSNDVSVPVKPPTTFKQQTEILKKRGLIIKDERYALKVLQRINCYRLSAYCLSLKNGDKFCEGVSFEHITELYEFDRKLRHLLPGIIEFVEIAFRMSVKVVP